MWWWLGGLLTAWSREFWKHFLGDVYVQEKKIAYLSKIMLPPNFDQYVFPWI